MIFIPFMAVFGYFFGPRFSFYVLSPIGSGIWIDPRLDDYAFDY